MLRINMSRVEFFSKLNKHPEKFIPDSRVFNIGKVRYTILVVCRKNNFPYKAKC